MVTFNINGETIWHETRTKVTGADVLMKPAAPGTGIIAGGTVRSIMGLTGVKNLISKSLGSTNKVNIAYAVIEGLRQQVPRSEWNNANNAKKADKAPAKEATTEKEGTKVYTCECGYEKTETLPKLEPAKKGCKKDLAALVVGVISLSMVGVLLKKKEK
jgi:hypothetical protein